MQLQVPQPRRLLMTVIAIDLVFIGLFILMRLTGAVPAWAGDIAAYAHMPDLFQFTKEGAIVLLAALLFRRFRQPAYAVACALMAVLWIDDMTTGHESMGGVFAAIFNYQAAFDLRAQDFGELTMIAIYLIVFVPLLVVTYRRAAPPERRFLRHFLILVGVLGCFGIGVDMGKYPLHNHPLARFISWTILEEGGEMLAISGILGFMYHTWRRTAHATPPTATEPATHVSLQPLVGDPHAPEPGP